MTICWQFIFLFYTTAQQFIYDTTSGIWKPTTRLNTYPLHIHRHKKNPIVYINKCDVWCFMVSEKKSNKIEILISQVLLYEILFYEKPAQIFIFPYWRTSLWKRGKTFPIFTKVGSMLDCCPHWDIFFTCTSIYRDFYMFGVGPFIKDIRIEGEGCDIDKKWLVGLLVPVATSPRERSN